MEAINMKDQETTGNHSQSTQSLLNTENMPFKFV